MKITSFDRDTCRYMRAILDEVLKDKRLSDCGISVRVGNGSFNSNRVTFKIEMATINSEDGTVNTELVDDFKRYCEMYGLKPDDLGRTVIGFGEKGKIVGLAPRSYKYPILVEYTDGKIRKWPIQTVRAGLI